LRLLQKNEILENQAVHIGGHEAAKGLVGSANDGLTPDVETGVDDHGAPGEFVKPPHQAVESAVTFWVGGFDIFYALQDEQFDRSEGLHAAVVRFGQPHGILLAKVLHSLALLALLWFGWGAGLGWIYYAGVAIGAGVIAYEHQLVRPADLSRLDAAFFTMNGIVSIVVFLGALGDRLL
jgi:4-hydroxybenzoate polyprenyltransferase